MCGTDVFFGPFDRSNDLSPFWRAGINNLAKFGDKLPFELDDADTQPIRNTKSMTQKVAQ
jgi:hypothetical protein